jgi:hypothetical protein
MPFITLNELIKGLTLYPAVLSVAASSEHPSPGLLLVL